jgi:hypothetical protein
MEAPGKLRHVSLMQKRTGRTARKPGYRVTRLYIPSPVPLSCVLKKNLDGEKQTFPTAGTRGPEDGAR